MLKWLIISASTSSQYTSIPFTKDYFTITINYCNNSVNVIKQYECKVTVGFTEP